MDIQQIKFNELYTLTVNKEEVDLKGRTQIADLLDVHFSRYGGLENVLPKDWSWAWKVPRGKFAGTLPKRLQNLVYKAVGAKLSPEVVSQIGNIAAKNSQARTTFYFDFNNQFNWQRGDFGDSESCFFGGKVDTLQLLASVGAFAIRLFDAPEGNGIGRAWVLPWRAVPRSGIPPAGANPDALLVFNGYGSFKHEYQKVEYQGVIKQYGEMQTLDYGRLLATWLGQSYQLIKLSVNGSSDENALVFINNEGRSAVMVGPMEVVSAFKKDDEDNDRGPVDLGWSESFLASLYDACPGCGLKMFKEGFRGAPPIKRYTFSNTGEAVYCVHCKRAKGTKCADCGVTLFAPKARSISLHGNRVYFCAKHAAENLLLCPLCAREEHIQTASEILVEVNKNGLLARVVVCHGCRNDCLQCGQCKSLFHRSLARNRAGRATCPACQAPGREVVSKATLTNMERKYVEYRRDRIVFRMTHEWKFLGREEIPEDPAEMLDEMGVDDRAYILKFLKMYKEEIHTWQYDEENDLLHGMVKNTVLWRYDRVSDLMERIY